MWGAAAWGLQGALREVPGARRCEPPWADRGGWVHDISVAPERARSALSVLRDGETRAAPAWWGEAQSTLRPDRDEAARPDEPPVDPRGYALRAREQLERPVHAEALRAGDHRGAGQSAADAASRAPVLRDPGAFLRTVSTGTAGAVRKGLVLAAARAR